MRMKSIVLLMLALGCGMIAAIGVKQVLSQDKQVKIAKIETENVLVALEDIERGEFFSPKNVCLEQWPKGKAIKGAISDFEAIEGCRARSKIVQGELILEQRLLGKGEWMTATDHIPQGYRVFSLRTGDMSGATQLLNPGDKVDVVAHFRKNPNYGIEEPMTQTVLQGVTVFSVGKDYSSDIGEKEDDSKDRSQAISLLVKPEQVEELSLIRELAKVQLVLRSPNDQQEVTSQGRTAAQILGLTVHEEEKAKAEKEAEETRQIEIKRSQGKTWRIRVIGGTEVEDIRLREKRDATGKSLWTLETIDSAEQDTEPVSIDLSEPLDSH
jgi:pilus assembly protein CpaB